MLYQFWRTLKASNSWITSHNTDLNSPCFRQPSTQPRNVWHFSLPFWHQVLQPWWKADCHHWCTHTLSDCWYAAKKKPQKTRGKYTQPPFETGKYNFHTNFSFKLTLKMGQGYHWYNHAQFSKEIILLKILKGCIFIYMLSTQVWFPSAARDFSPRVNF